MIRRVREGLAVLGNAVQLLTRLPVPGDPYRPERLQRVAPWLPVVGLLVGGLSALVYLGATFLWPGWLPLLLALLSSVLLTGGLHEDGLADSFDALGAGPDRERRRAVLKDSRLGVYGALALGFAVLLKLAALGLLEPPRVAGALVAAHVWNRWSIAAVLWRTPYLSGEEGMAARMAAGSTAPRVAVGAAVCLAVGALALGWASLPAAAVALLVVVVGRRFWRRALGGVTGDSLGSVCQGIEVAIYLLLPLLPEGWFPYP